MDTIFDSLEGPPLKTPPTLHQITERVLTNWRSSIDDLGDVPYYLIYPVLKECSASQLAHIEQFNPEIVEEDDELWKPLCLKDFFEVRQEYESNTLPTVISWRDLYMEHEHKKNLKFEQWSKKLKERYAQVHNQKKHTIYTEDVPPPPRGMSSGWASFGPRKTTRGFSIAAKARAETRHISSIYKSNTNPNSGYRRRKDTTIGNSFSNGSLRAKSESPLTSRYGSKPIIGRSPQGSSQSPPSEKILRKVHPDIKNIERKQCNEIKAPIFTQNASKLHTSESIFKNNPTSTPVTSKVFSSSWNSYQSSISEGNFKRAKTDTSVIRKIRSETRNQPYTPASSSRSPPYQSTPYNRSKTTTTRAYSPTYNSSTIKTKSPKSPSSSNQIGNNNGHTQEPGSNSWCSPEVDASFFAMLHGKKPPKKLRGNSD